MATEIFLTRHGVTEWNKKKRVQGQTDIPLSTDGIVEARELGKKIEGLGITVIASSPLLRALETSLELGNHLGIAAFIYGGLSERFYGEFEGRLFDDVNAQLKKKNTTLKSYSTEEGESYSDFKTRVIAAFEGITNEHKNEKILFVCHGGVMEVLAKHLSKTEDENGDNGDIGYSFANASLFAFTV